MTATPSVTYRVQYTYSDCAVRVCVRPNSRARLISPRFVQYVCRSAEDRGQWRLRGSDCSQLEVAERKEVILKEPW